MGCDASGIDSNTEDPIRLKVEVWSCENTNTLRKIISIKHLHQSSFWQVQSELSWRPDWPKIPLLCCPQGNHSVSCKSYGNLVNEQIQIKIHREASRQHMHWLAGTACCSLSTIFFKKMPSVFSSLQIFECLFSVCRICSSLVPLSFPDLSLSYFLFNLLCALFLPLHCFLPRLPTPSPISLPLLQFSPSLSLDSFTITLSFPLPRPSCMIDAAIYFPCDPRGIWKVYVHVSMNSVCTCGWVTAEEDWWFLTSSPHLHLILAPSLIALYCHTDRTESRFINSIQLR